ncbi:GMC family oxidoreductase [Aspergillus mulundensis]|uniref:glucose oxidase n=1 Tax=Aspergillus mulundensis TaxID=1810919 RepID=A0A3D8SB71_9EURO|nr:Glucose-methanol-choline oxidoreductase [Aspergillus mulundensis]RDW83550.1 Glucose-methanol-choline oxidoreductase [Aspergillus mulundensis]
MHLPRAVAALALVPPAVAGLVGTSFGVPGTNATFDYIVVGGGTAGLTLATRLAEQQSGSVAVVEAGGFYEVDNGNISQVPATGTYYTGRSPTDWQPLIDWGYVTTPQAGSYGDELLYPRGKCLGGSSARNFMLYHRGTKASYQLWADAVGDSSYTFGNLLPFFEKSLHFTPPDNSMRLQNATPEYDPRVMGNGTGPLSVSYSRYVHAFGTWAAKGLEALGMSSVPGLSSGSLIGQSYGTFTINATTGIRDSSETSFLRKALPYTNYQVYKTTLAKKVLFDDKKRATAVIVNTAGMTYQLSARKEIIISGGAFGSPQLLLASGVGPADTLQALDIPVVAHRPGVGQNMQDHNGTGIYSNPGTDVVGWEKIPNSHRRSFSNRTLAALAQYPGDWPEVEYLPEAAYFGYQQVRSTADPNDGHNYATLAVALVAPRSRGNLTISSADTAVNPLINPNWFTDPADMEVAIAGFKRAREFWNSTAMQPFALGEEAFPGPQVQSDAEIDDIIRRSFTPVYHAACTCAMGKANDTMAVVDTKARVYGVKGLRVVDAAAFPFLPPGHPQATVYALAEKIACDITGAC